MTVLFRPVGVYELAHIVASGWRRYPPRLPEQPIFYPVLEEAYAVEIASRWNPPDPNSGYAGFLTRFEVADEVCARYPAQVVGARRHRELWVPAEEQEGFLNGMIGTIEVKAGWAGEGLDRVIPSWRGRAGPMSEATLREVVEAVTSGPVLGAPQTTGEP